MTGLQRRVALVTGASRGIGRRIAMSLAEAGVAVAVNSLHSREEGLATVREITDAGGTAAYVQGDVASYASMQEVVATAVQELGALSLLVNSADWFVAKRFEEEGPEEWQRTMAVGAMGVVHSVAAALPSMKASGYGKIVSIAGDSGRVGLTGAVVHSGAKAAVIGMTKSWARELAPYGIRVNAVSPGPISDTPGRSAWQSSEFGALGEVSTYLGDGRPEDIANAVVFLLSEASDYITGQTLSVNGGRAFPS